MAPALNPGKAPDSSRVNDVVLVRKSLLNRVFPVKPGDVVVHEYVEPTWCVPGVGPALLTNVLSPPLTRSLGRPSAMCCGRVLGLQRQLVELRNGSLLAVLRDRMWVEADQPGFGIDEGEVGVHWVALGVVRTSTGVLVLACRLWTGGVVFVCGSFVFAFVPPLSLCFVF